MANRSAWTPFLFFSLILTLFSYMACAGNISFAFPPQTEDMKVDPEAYFQGDKIQLTKNEYDVNMNWSVGSAIYNKPVPLWDKSSGALADFTSYFKFVIYRTTKVTWGDGLAFFIAPFDFKPLAHAWGEGLGLFNLTTNGSFSNHLVAVEFDTYKNSDYDPDGNQVGIDVNSVVSVATFSPSSSLSNGTAWDAWVDYDGSTKKLQVFLLHTDPNISSKPTSPILTHQIDLRRYIPEMISVGITASTAGSYETHRILAWNFSCAYSWDISSAPPSSNIPSSAPSHAVSSPPPSNIPSSAPSHTVCSPSRTQNSSQKIILITLVVCIAGICCFLFIAVWWYFKKRAPRDDQGEEGERELDEQLAQGPCKFSYAQLSAATHSFSNDEILGEGGFGSVYKGILPTTKETVAIKRISQGSRQGRKEYISEVTIISKLRHRNLVRLLGWCHEQGELLLVYEFLPNGSLDKYIFNEREDCLNWEQRYSVACGIASALIYLHEEWDQRVVHRDVKASNILLDSNFNAKLGDFGLARVVERDGTASYTTMVAGTRGYMAPEYMESGKASPKSDVYSFGAVALEIACGRHPIDYSLHEYNFKVVAWVWDFRRQGKLLDAADNKLRGNFNSEDNVVVSVRM